MKSTYQDQDVVFMSKSLHRAQMLHQAIIVATKEVKMMLAREKEGKPKAKAHSNVFKMYLAHSYPEVTQNVVFDDEVDDPLTAIVDQVQEFCEE